MLSRNTEVLLEIGTFLRFGFKIVQLEMAEDEIEHGEASLDVFHFVLAAIAEIFASEVPVELGGENVGDHAVCGKIFAPGVFVGVEFGPEGRSALALVRAGERQKLPGQKVPGMRGHEIEEVGLLRRVSEGLEGLDMSRGNGHRERILAVSPWSSRMRRRREASSRWLYTEKPAFAFSATPRGP